MRAKAPEAAAEWVPIDSLTAWDENPRKNDAAVPEVAASIKRFGFGTPILARKADRMIIAGHTRLKAAKLLGLDQVPVRFLDLDPADARLLNFADNRLGEIAEWDNERLGHLMAELHAQGAPLEASGFTPEEIAQLLHDAQGAPPEEPEGPLPEPPAEPRTKLGDLYILGGKAKCPHCAQTTRVGMPAAT